MNELPFLVLIKEVVLVLFFLIFSGMIWWLYFRTGNQELEKHRFDVLGEEGTCG